MVLPNLVCSIDIRYAFLAGCAAFFIGGLAFGAVSLGPIFSERDARTPLAHFLLVLPAFPGIARSWEIPGRSTGSSSLFGPLCKLETEKRTPYLPLQIAAHPPRNSRANLNFTVANSGLHSPGIHLWWTAS
jgi:hypothetical protein